MCTTAIPLPAVILKGSKMFELVCAYIDCAMSHMAAAEFNIAHFRYTADGYRIYTWRGAAPQAPG